MNELSEISRATLLPCCVETIQIILDIDSNIPLKIRLWPLVSLSMYTHTSQRTRNAHTWQHEDRYLYFDYHVVRVISSVHYELTIVLNDKGQASSGQADKRFSGIKIYGTATSFSEFMGCKVEAHRRSMTATVWGSTENVSRGQAESVNGERRGKKDEKHREKKERIVKLQKVLGRTSRVPPNAYWIK